MSQHDGAERYQPRLNMWKRGPLWEHLAPLPERQRHAEMMQLMERGLRLEGLFARMAESALLGSIGTSSEGGHRSTAPTREAKPFALQNPAIAPGELLRDWDFNDP